ncbi:MAG TPA: vitamin B12 dependent-methionine synthase activation domain-containing protein, partial [Rhodoferax sp.]|nr:vitamin B12 dependent-methionine synthase activation domain-containing protein [Rhodoferax sp.]
SAATDPVTSAAPLPAASTATDRPAETNRPRVVHPRTSEPAVARTPAPGYPACPDHSVKKDMFTLLQCDDIGMTLTESLAMNPAASVSGFYIGHPAATYFNVGKIGDDQLKDLAARRGMNERDLQRLLAPNL